MQSLLPYLTAGSAVEDCGTLALDDPLEKVTAVRTCIASAVANGTSYRAIWQVPGTDSLVQEGRVAVRRSNGVLETFRFFYDGMGGSFSEPVSSWNRCGSAWIRENCSIPERVCMTCGPEYTHQCKCEQSGSGERPGLVTCVP
jgi:hypothetical protein